MKKSYLALLVFILAAVFMSCTTNNNESNTYDDENGSDHLEIIPFSSNVKFDEKECKEKFENWKKNGPKNYSFFYECDVREDPPMYCAAKVTVKDGKPSNVVFCGEYYNNETGRYEFDTLENLANNGKGSSCHVEIDKDGDFKEYYISSINQIFEYVLKLYDENRDGIENKTYFETNFIVDYSPDGYLSHVCVAIEKDEREKDENGEYMHLVPHGYVVLYNVKISDFTVLDE